MCNLIHFITAAGIAFTIGGCTTEGTGVVYHKPANNHGVVYHVSANKHKHRHGVVYHVPVNQNGTEIHVGD